ncbi:MAG: hypothetical protein KGL39_03920 [Patescibacteria group bacterium]|nr:hypothetical protein [Patescibacteria group bacterium]
MSKQPTSALPRVLCVMLIDSSGSMSSKESATEKGFNAYVETIQGVTAGAFLSLYFFDYSIRRVVEYVPACDVGPTLFRNHFRVGGGTAMCQSVNALIDATEAAIAGDPNPPKVVMCIMTDGEEIKHDHWPDLRKRMAEKQKQGWQFNYLGAGVNSVEAASWMGIPTDNAMTYSLSGASTVDAFKRVARAALRYASGRTTQASIKGKEAK